jgi:plastocyanin
MKLHRLTALGLVLLLPACGGDRDSATTDAPAASGSPTVDIAPGPGGAAGQTPLTPDEGREIVEVRMVTTQNGASGVFEPAQVTVRRGDVIRWIQADAQAPHNVSFTMGQGNPPGFRAPQDSPFLTRQGETFELRVEWEDGTYNYVCVPHAATGMLGSVTVAG